MKPSTLLPLAALFSTSVLAAPETYVIDGTHTLPRFSYSHFGYSTQLSRFDKTTGKIILDRQAKTGSVDVTVDTTSVNTGSALFNEHIQGADFLDTAHHPTMTFNSNQLNFEGDKLVSIDQQTGYADGDLIPVHAASDAEKRGLRRECHHGSETHRFQYG